MILGWTKEILLHRFDKAFSYRGCLQCQVLEEDTLEFEPSSTSYSLLDVGRVLHLTELSFLCKVNTITS